MSADAGSAVSGAIDGGLVDEAAVAGSLQSRGAGVITTSGALVTLALAAAAIVTGRQDYAPPLGARWVLSLSLVAFLAAATLGLLVNRPGPARTVATADLRRYTEDDLWRADPSAVRRRLAQARVEVLAAAQAANDRRAGLLQRAYAAEIVGVGLVGVAVAWILLAG